MISHEMRTLSFTLPLKIRGIKGVMNVSQSFHNSPACQALACLRQSSRLPENLFGEQVSEGKQAGLPPLNLRGGIWEGLVVALFNVRGEILGDHYVKCFFMGVPSPLTGEG
jgi:hypothetical protein